MRFIGAAAAFVFGIQCLFPTSSWSEGGSPAGSARQGEELKSGKPRIARPACDADDLATLVSGNSAFAIDLYQAERRRSDGNLFYSPFSISMALAMTYAGARQDTGAQMAKALRFDLPQGKLHPAFNFLDRALASRGKGARGSDGKGFRLNIVNATWGQSGHPFLDEYIDTLAESYGAGLRLVDFRSAPEPSRVTINEWVAKQTEDRIRNLLPPGVITIYTRMVLTNAIYFNAAWQDPFDEARTKDGTFHLIGGGEKTVPMMWQKETLRYARGDGYQAVELPYDGKEMSMVVLVPDTGKFEEFEAGLDAGSLAMVLGSLKTARVDLTMPRFKFDADLGVKPILIDLGMTDAFEAGVADLSGMDGGARSDLHIADVLHKAFVSVDEKGTEAAAATSVVMGVTSAPTIEAKVVLDRPFLFLIRDIGTGSILFFGRLMDPTG